MGMKKARAVAEQPIVADLAKGIEQPESGATAAIERLSKPKAGLSTAKAEAKPAYKAYDADANALGKTRCVMFNAAVMSPAIAGMRFNDMKEYLALVREAADAGVAYSFQK